MSPAPYGGRPILGAPGGQLWPAVMVAFASRGDAWGSVEGMMAQQMEAPEASAPPKHEGDMQAHLHTGTQPRITPHSPLPTSPRAVPSVKEVHMPLWLGEAVGEYGAERQVGQVGQPPKHCREACPVPGMGSVSCLAPGL